MIAGEESVLKQQSSELKHLSKSSRNKVCEDAGVQQSGKLSSDTLIALKTALGLTSNQMRAQRRLLKSAGIKYASEKIQRAETETIVPGCLITSETINMWHKADKNPKSVKGMVRKPTPSAYITDLKKFILNLLDEYNNIGKLVWENFPADEVWLKIGADQGGG
jgi:hypothetical protein